MKDFNTTPLPPLISVEKGNGETWQIVVRVGYFTTKEVAEEAAEHLLQGTMWESSSGIFSVPKPTIH